MGLGNLLQGFKFVQEGRRCRKNQFGFLGNGICPFQDAGRALKSHFPGGETVRTYIAPPPAPYPGDIVRDGTAVHDRGRASAVARKAAHRILSLLNLPALGLACAPRALC